MADYTTQDKLLAIGLIERNGGTLSKAVLAEVRNLLNAPAINKTTVYRWWQSREKLQRVATVQPEKKGDDPDTMEMAIISDEQAALLDDEAWVHRTLSQYFAHTAIMYLTRANQPKVIAETKGKDAVMTAAIATDKMRLLLNLPTEIVMMLPDVLAAIDRANLKASDVFNQIISQLNEADNAGG